MAHLYKASKAWHHSVLLASDVERLVGHFAEQGETILARRLRLASQSAQRWLEDSHQHADLGHRLDCYHKARTGIEQIQADLMLARNLNYIDADLHDYLVKQAIHIYQLLTELIRTTNKATA